jgi:hypothetical protein
MIQVNKTCPKTIKYVVSKYKVMSWVCQQEKDPSPKAIMNKIQGLKYRDWSEWISNRTPYGAYST